MRILSISNIFYLCDDIDLMFKKPTHHKNWDASMSRLPRVSWISESIFTIQDLRSWKYGEEEILSKKWTDSNFDLDNLEKVLFYLQPFGPSWGVAHTFLVFVFIDPESRTEKRLGLSIEARRSEDRLEMSVFDLLSSLNNEFELLYQWATADDLITRREKFLQERVFEYRLQVTQDEAQTILSSCLQKTTSIEQSPEFYKLFSHNCTTGLIHHINKGLTGKKILPHYSFICTGEIANYLVKKKFLIKKRI